MRSNEIDVVTSCVFEYGGDNDDDYMICIRLGRGTGRANASQIKTRSQFTFSEVLWKPTMSFAFRAAGGFSTSFPSTVFSASPIREGFLSEQGTRSRNSPYRS